MPIKRRAVAIWRPMPSMVPSPPTTTQVASSPMASTSSVSYSRDDPMAAVSLQRHLAALCVRKWAMSNHLFGRHDAADAARRALVFAYQGDATGERGFMQKLHH